MPIVTFHYVGEKPEYEDLVSLRSVIADALSCNGDSPTEANSVRMSVVETPYNISEKPLVHILAYPRPINQHELANRIRLVTEISLGYDYQIVVQFSKLGLA